MSALPDGWRTYHLDGHDNDGNPWGDMIVVIPAQNLSLNDDKFILLAYQFDAFMPGLSDDDLQEVVKQYTARVYKVLAEMTLRGIAQKPVDEQPKKTRRKKQPA